jgi:hypothetical protein
MKCEEVEAKIIDYLDKNLEEGTRQEIEKHLETCEKCFDDVRESQQVLNTLSREAMSKPDDSLRINFYHMLHNQIMNGKQGKSISSPKPSIPWYYMGRYRVAAGIALLLCGTFAGLFIHAGLNNSHTSDKLKLLQSEVYLLKRSTMFTMLKEESSSDRIQAVSFADEIDNPDENIISALVTTLNNDKNVNVRMAAAYALSRFASQRNVCDSLVRSLSIQNDPILQITLINILAERREKSVVTPLQHIISDKNTLKEVRDAAENCLGVLM